MESASPQGLKTTADGERAVAYRCTFDGKDGYEHHTVVTGTREGPWSVEHRENSGTVTLAEGCGDLEEAIRLASAEFEEFRAEDGRHGITGWHPLEVSSH